MIWVWINNGFGLADARCLIVAVQNAVLNLSYHIIQIWRRVITIYLYSKLRCRAQFATKLLSNNDIPSGIEWLCKYLAMLHGTLAITSAFTEKRLILTDKVVVLTLLALTQCFLKWGKTVCFLLYTVFFVVYCFTKYNAL